MKPAAFEYHRPATVAEAVAVLAEYGRGREGAGRWPGAGPAAVDAPGRARTTWWTSTGWPSWTTSGSRPGRSRSGRWPGTAASSARRRRGPAAAGPGAGAGRPPDDPQPRHHRRQHRARRPVGGDDGRAGLLGGSVTVASAGGERNVPAADSSSARWSRRCGRVSWRSRRAFPALPRGRVGLRRGVPPARRLRRVRGRRAGRAGRRAGRRARAGYLVVAGDPAGAGPDRRSGSHLDADWRGR